MVHIFIKKRIFDLVRAESVILQWSSQVAVGFIVILLPLITLESV